MLTVTLLLVRGTRESAAVNLVMVVVKLVVLTFFIIAAFTSFESGNLKPFNPEGVTGITAAAGIIFFAYIGFDAVSTASEESKNPVARPADRDRRITGDLHDLLHPGGDRGDRPGAGSRPG